MHLYRPFKGKGSLGIGTLIHICNYKIIEGNRKTLRGLKKNENTKATFFNWAESHSGLPNKEVRPKGYFLKLK